MLRAAFACGAHRVVLSRKNRHADEGSQPLASGRWHPISWISRSPALAAPIGWDREQEERSAGIRTFPSSRSPPAGFVLWSRSACSVRTRRARPASSKVWITVLASSAAGHPEACRACLRHRDRRQPVGHGRARGGSGLRPLRHRRHPVPRHLPDAALPRAAEAGCPTATEATPTVEDPKPIQRSRTPLRPRVSAGAVLDRKGQPIRHFPAGTLEAIQSMTGFTRSEGRRPCAHLRSIVDQG